MTYAHDVGDVDYIDDGCAAAPRSGGDVEGTCSVLIGPRSHFDGHR